MTEVSWQACQASKNPIVRQTEEDEAAPLSSSSKLRQARPDHWGVESIAAPEFEGISNITLP